MTAVPVNQIICGDNVETLRTLPDACVDSCVTDPPYGLSFMGKKWDYDVPSVEVWQECLRVLKPGGHLLAFAGTRTQHRMAVRIEDAGFEIRDMIAWVYGSGFSKSMDVSKAIDAQDAVEERRARALRFTAWMREACPLSASECNQIMGTKAEAGHYFTDGEQPHIAVAEHFDKLRPHFVLPVPEDIKEMVRQRTVESQTLKNREVVGYKTGQQHADGRKSCFDVAEKMIKVDVAITAPATEAAKQWAGWGTSVRPALEPVTWARKPLIGTVAANVLRHGTGAVNVDGCKVDGERLPANFIHDGSEEAVSLLGEADRFFYCAKAGPEERRQSKHPTIKPVALMRYLVRLVTPPGGLVLDPFGGSGTTAEAARLEHCRFLLMELNPEYCADAAERLRQGVLF
jgi:site-specific DNA-methyltransferase (adenine-specific)